MTIELERKKNPWGPATAAKARRKIQVDPAGKWRPRCAPKTVTQDRERLFGWGSYWGKLFLVRGETTKEKVSEAVPHRSNKRILATSIQPQGEEKLSGKKLGGKKIEKTGRDDYTKKAHQPTAKR